MCFFWIMVFSRHVWCFPQGTSGKEPACQWRRCKRCEFNPWVRKIPWRRAWQPTPVFLPKESHGQRNLVGYSPWYYKRVRHDWSDSAHMQKHLQSSPPFIFLVTLKQAFWSTYSAQLTMVRRVIETHLYYFNIQFSSTCELSFWLGPWVPSCPHVWDYPGLGSESPASWEPLTLRQTGTVGHSGHWGNDQRKKCF